MNFTCLKKLFTDIEDGNLACECQCNNNCPNKVVEKIDIKDGHNV